MRSKTSLRGVLESGSLEWPSFETAGTPTSEWYESASAFCWRLLLWNSQHAQARTNDVAYLECIAGYFRVALRRDRHGDMVPQPIHEAVRAPELPQWTGFTALNSRLTGVLSPKSDISCILSICRLVILVLITTILCHPYIDHINRLRHFISARLRLV